MTKPYNYYITSNRRTILDKQGQEKDCMKLMIFSCINFSFIETLTKTVAKPLHYIPLYDQDGHTSKHNS